MKIITGIYKITNPKGQVYVGQSINIERRFKEYRRLAKRSAGRKLLNSLKGFGVENHTFEIIEECIVALLHSRETYWKIFFDTVEKGLNCDYFDQGGGPRCQEIRDRISKSNLGKPKSEAHKANMRGPKSEEHKKNISIAKQQITEETKKKISESKTGKKHTTEHIRNIVESKQKPILQYDLQGNFIKEWSGTKIAALHLGCDPTTITANLRGITKKGFGYIWKRKTT
jgi:group I intron endonuclease